MGHRNYQKAFEIRDIVIPQELEDSMSRQAQAEPPEWVGIVVIVTVILILLGIGILAIARNRR